MKIAATLKTLLILMTILIASCGGVKVKRCSLYAWKMPQDTELERLDDRRENVLKRKAGKRFVAVETKELSCWKQNLRNLIHALESINAKLEN